MLQSLSLSFFYAAIDSLVGRHCRMLSHELHPFRSHAGNNFLESTPWFDAYKAEFLRLLAFNDHETVDHPAACARFPQPGVRFPSVCTCDHQA